MTDPTPTSTPASKPNAPLSEARPAAVIPRPASASTIKTPEPILPAPTVPPGPALPQITIDEMEAGRKALERNRPVAQALETARVRAAEPKV